MWRKMKKDIQGSSIVSVIVAFVILLLGLSMITTAVSATLNVYNRATGIRRDAEGAVAAYYLEEYSDDEITVKKDIVFTLRSADQPDFVAQFEGEYRIYSYPSRFGNGAFDLYHFQRTGQ